jgi:hypothetical protein
MPASFFDAKIWCIKLGHIFVLLQLAVHLYSKNRSQEYVGVEY